MGRVLRATSIISVYSGMRCLVESHLKFAPSLWPVRVYDNRLTCHAQKLERGLETLASALHCSIVTDFCLLTIKVLFRKKRTLASFFFQAETERHVARRARSHGAHCCLWLCVSCDMFASLFRCLAHVVAHSFFFHRRDSALHEPGNPTKLLVHNMQLWVLPFSKWHLPAMFVIH